MKTTIRKVTVICAACMMLIMTTGFADLEVETSAGIGAIMDDLTSADLEEIQNYYEWDGKVLANVEDYVTVRSEPSADSTAVGRLYADCSGDILERLDGWTLISSGDVEGYVSNDYLLFGEEAYEQAKEVAQLTATSTAAGLRIRAEASTDSKILKNIEKGAKLSVTEGYDTDGAEWIQVDYAEGKTGYVSAEYVELDYELGEAMTMEEVKAAEEEARREALKQKLEAFQANGDEVTLLAALIQAEGGNQPYDGQVAIGAVVMNRVKSSRYPNTIAEVIFAAGQFSVVSNGSIERYLSNPKASCVQAAQDAINGYTTVGSYTHFKNASLSVSTSDYIIIGNHVFY